MHFARSEEQQRIREEVLDLCRRFDDAYWLRKDHEGGFPDELYRAMTDGGWLGTWPSTC